MTTVATTPRVTSNGFDIIRSQRRHRSVVASNLPKDKALAQMRNLKRRAIDGRTNVYFSIAPHTA